MLSHFKYKFSEHEKEHEEKLVYVLNVDRSLSDIRYKDGEKMPNPFIVKGGDFFSVNVEPGEYDFKIFGVRSDGEPEEITGIVYWID